MTRKKKVPSVERILPRNRGQKFFLTAILDIASRVGECLAGNPTSSNRFSYSLNSNKGSGRFIKVVSSGPCPYYPCTVSLLSNICAVVSPVTGPKWGNMKTVCSSSLPGPLFTVFHSTCEG